MWLLHFFSDSFLQFIVNAVLITGAVGTVLFCFFFNKILQFFPPLAPYYKALQIGSIVVLLAGVYFKGGYATEMIWRDKVKEVEAKLAAAEAESKKETVKIVERVVKKTEIIQRRGQDVVSILIEKLSSMIQNFYLAVYVKYLKNLSKHTMTLLLQLRQRNEISIITITSTIAGL